MTFATKFQYHLLVLNLPVIFKSDMNLYLIISVIMLIFPLSTFFTLSHPPYFYSICSLFLPSCVSTLVYEMKKR